jgi:hypothetical protein
VNSISEAYELELSFNCESTTHFNSSLIGTPLLAYPVFDSEMARFMFVKIAEAELAKNALKYLIKNIINISFPI